MIIFLSLTHSYGMTLNIKKWQQIMPATSTKKKINTFRDFFFAYHFSPLGSRLLWSHTSHIKMPLNFIHCHRDLCKWAFISSALLSLYFFPLLNYSLIIKCLMMRMPHHQVCIHFDLSLISSSSSSSL